MSDIRLLERIHAGVVRRPGLSPHAAVYTVEQMDAALREVARLRRELLDHPKGPTKRVPIIARIESKEIRAP